MKHERRQNGALVSFIGYKGSADWLLALILKWIADRLILYPNHRSIERIFLNAFKSLKAAYFFGFEGLLVFEITTTKTWGSQLSYLRKLRWVLGLRS